MHHGQRQRGVAFAPEQCVPFCRFAPRSTLLNSVYHLVFCRFAPEECVPFCRFAPVYLFCRFAPEQCVPFCRFAPRSRFAPEQCVSFCRFAPRSRLQRQRGRDSVRIISLRSRLDPRAGREGRACCGAKCCSQHAPRRTRSLRSARGRLSLGGFASCALFLCQQSRCGLSRSRADRHTHTRKGPPLWDHPLRMCAWLGKPDCSRQRPAD